MLRRGPLAVVCSLCTVLICGCGIRVPQVEEIWEPVSVPASMETRIKENIFCETVRALRDVKRDITINGQPVIPDSYGVQMQLTLTIEEVSALNPSVGAQDVLPNGISNKITVPQSFALNGAATLSSTATRTDTSYSYYNVGKITARGANPFCNQPVDLRGSSPLLKSDLGIEAYLREAAPGSLVFSSSVQAAGGAGKGARYDVFSYEIKFVVVTSGSISPVWKLVNLNAGTGSLPLANAGRTRTHDLTLTFGPGTNAPLDFALQTHFTGRVVQALQSLQSLQTPVPSVPSLAP
jgi:hypothetical protein